MECPICYQEYLNPVRLQCRHIFCFLCIKGAASSSRKCPLCRHDIADRTLDEPQIIPLDEIAQEESDEPANLNKDECQVTQDRFEANRMKGGHREANGRVKESDDSQGELAANDEIRAKTKTIIKDIPVFEDDRQWFYEGRNGWWLYDQRTSRELETAFKEKHPKIELLIAGHLYVIDFQQMLQYRRSDPNKFRRIKRDHLPADLIKGIAGIKLPSSICDQDDPESGSSKDEQPVSPPPGQQRPNSATVQISDTQPGLRASNDQSDDIGALSNMMAQGLNLNSNEVSNSSHQESGSTSRSGRSARQVRETAI